MSLTQKITALQDYKEYAELNWSGTFDEYLDIVRKNPKVSRTAYQRVYDMILSYGVTVHEEQAMATVKTRLGVPAADASCHTALIGGYVIEGHVPVEDIRRLLAEHPDARGLAAPGMPMGSPGMPAMTMGSPQSYAVVLIGKDGSSRVFATHVPKA